MNSQRKNPLTKGVRCDSKLVPKGKVCAGCLPEHQERQLEMWEVIAKSKVTGDEIRHVTTSWKEAKSLAMLALDVELRVQILKIYTDLLIADHATGELVLFKSRISPKEAARYTVSFAKADRSRGCLLWPHGKPMPGVFEAKRKLHSGSERCCDSPP